MALFRREPARHRVTVSSPTKSLTAAGVRVHHRDAQLMRRLIQPWQTRALAYYDMIGEIKFAANYVGNAMSLLILNVAQIQPDGEVKPTDNPVAVDALARIQDPGGGAGARSGLQEQYGKLMFLTGEVYLLVSNDPFNGLEQWEMLSTNELRVMDGTIMRYRAPSLMIQNYHEAPDEDFFPVGDEAVAYRLWRRSPLYSGLGDSSMTGVLLLCEELLKLTAVVRARATSRLAGPGILFLSDAFSQTPLEPTGDEDALNDILLQDIIEAATTAIENEGSAAAVAPLLVRVPVPDGMKLQDMVYHLQITDPMQLYPETGLREECIRRIATGLDIPAEILTGLAQASHWSGWLVDEQVWKSHLQPMAMQLVSDLTQSYLRPYLRDQGVQDWQTFVIDFDASAIINHPDRGAAADAAYANGTLSDDSYRKAKGFDDADAPSEEEKDMWLGAKVRDASLAKFGIPSLKPGGLEPEAGVIESGDKAAGGEVTAPQTVSQRGPGGSAGGTAKVPPEQPVPGDVIGSLDSGRVAIAAELAVLRAREVAGSRLRNYAKKSPDALAAINGVRAGQIAATLGRETVLTFCKVGEAQLVEGTRELVEDALRSLHVTDTAVLDLLVAGVERHAAQTLYEARPGPLPQPLVNRVAAAAKKNGAKP